MARRQVLDGNKPKAPATIRAAAGLPPRVGLMAVLAWLLLLGERFLTAVTLPLTVLAAALAIAWLDLPRLLPVWGHVALLVLSAGAMLYALWRGFRPFRLPGWREALRRLEQDSGLAHRPLTHIDDAQASNLIDPAATSLWQRHRARLLASIGRLDLGWPQTDWARRDPLALRHLALLLAIAALGVSNEAWLRRIDQALLPNFSGIEDGDQIMVEAWITPPDYTGLPPISLSGDQAVSDGKPIDVPAGSKLLMQAQGLPTSGLGGPATLSANGASLPFEVLDPTTQRAETTLTTGESIGVKSGLSTVVEWPLRIVADMAPSAAFAGEPQVTDRGVLRLTYGVRDDYGVTDLRLVVSRGSENFEFKLPLSQSGVEDGARTGRGGSFQDLTAHSWAGLDVELRLVARDAMGQIGASAPLAMTLPERKFFHPVARAIIEQRKRLAADWRDHQEAARELMILKAQPETYDGKIVAFMGMDFAARRLLNPGLAPSDLPPILQLMWDTAIDIEDGGTSLALSEFRRLQQELQEALDRGASDEEIERLMNQLQEAMNRYMQELQQQMQRAMENGQQMRQLSPNGLKLSQQDLNQMLNDARRMAQSGAKDSAKQMLDQLQKMMENLQAGVPTMMSREGQQAQQMANELGRLMQRQQKLLEESYNAQRGQQPGQQGMGEGEQSSGEGMPGDAGNGSGNGLGAAGQEQLRRDLGELMRQFGNTFGDLPDGLGQAEQSMRGAVENLNNEDFGGAAENQNNALSQLQQGMQSTQQMLQRQAGQVPGRGTRDRMDPLGRSTEDSSGANAVDSTNTNIDIEKSLNDPAKAREIFDELRQRRNDPGRPKQERDYLDRLLKQF